jgi:hypothetical protein
MNMYSILFGVALSAGIAASVVGEVREASAATSTTCSSNNTNISMDGGFTATNTFSQGITVPSGVLVESIALYVEHEAASRFTVRIMGGTSGPTSVLQTVVKTISVSNAFRSEWLTVNLSPFVPSNQKFWVSVADGQIDMTSNSSQIGLGGCLNNPYSGGQLHFMSQGTWNSSTDANFADRDAMVQVMYSSVATTTTTSIPATTVSPSTSTSIVSSGGVSQNETIVTSTTVISAPTTSTSAMTSGNATQRRSTATPTTITSSTTTSSLSSSPAEVSSQTPGGDQVGQETATISPDGDVTSSSGSFGTVQWLIVLLALALSGGAVFYKLTQRRR